MDEKVLFWVKEARLKKLHTVWFQVYDLPESDGWLSGAGRRGEGWLQIGTREFGGMLEVSWV